MSQLIIEAAVILVAGFFVGYYTRKLIIANKAKSLETKIANSLNETKAKQKEMVMEAKDKAFKIIEDAKRDEQGRRQELSNLQKRLERRESMFDQKLMDLEGEKGKLQEKAQQLEETKLKIQEIQKSQLEKLEKIAGLTKQEAAQVLVKNVETQMEESIMSRVKKLKEEGATVLDEEAKRILISAIQRCAINQAVETTTSTVNLPSDEMKGRIIGREGRNIKVLEQMTGTEIIIDDTPQAITISSFSPIRRQVAKRMLEKLILDGRIHPAKIESALEEAKQEVAIDIKKAGEEACYDVGIAGLDPKLVQIMGRLKYRTSYGQNVLQHSIEVAHLSALLAEQLGVKVAVAKKAGFLHDLGKAVDHEVQGTHPEIGRDIAKKFNLPAEIIAPILEHHLDTPTTVEGIIVKTADAISGARPGARKDTYENYLQRLSDLEGIATDLPGVEKAYAIQAGREVRVFVQPEQISDLQAQKLAEEIAKKIEAELKYPGEIKVTVIRENRVIEYAR
ncbi:MAG: ribonuclease Y [Candidatus Falkowbacteria bacterium]